MILHIITSNKFQGPVVGVTGSCGKTSTKDILSHYYSGKMKHIMYGREI